MARLVFDGKGHSITLFDKDNRLIGQWEAYNNVDKAHAKKSGLSHLENKTYVMENRTTPKKHPESDHWGSYGPYGIFKFKVEHHPGIGVHSGKPIPYRSPGPQHATHGCIRTTDEAMKTICDLAKNDPIETITVQNNSGLHVSNTDALLANISALLGSH